MNGRRVQAGDRTDVSFGFKSNFDSGIDHQDGQQQRRHRVAATS